MKQILKEWGIPVLVILITIPTYLYFNNASFEHFINRSFGEKPYVSLKNNAVFIDEFDYSIGVTGINQVSGDFNKLNEKVYALLKGKTGNYKVFLQVVKKDKYGNSTTEYQDIGSVNADELNKYESAEYWQESEGLQSLLTNESSTDSAVVMQAERSTIQPTATADSTTSINQSFDFNGMIGKPWTYYDVSNGEMKELTLNDEEIADAIKYWQQFIDDIEDLNVICKSSTATISLKTHKGVSEFELNKAQPNVYNMQGDPSIALHVISPTTCKIFFKSEGNCASVTNKAVKL